MDNLLTSRQVQELLQVDRITIYRMLQDGRLKGVKIGQQWRFPQADVDRLLGASPAHTERAAAAVDGGFPAHCVQTIQDLFAEVSQISALVVDMNGAPLTQVSHPTRLCQLLLSTISGEQLCRASWKDFARGSSPLEGQPGARFFTCQAGLQYIGAPVYDRETQIGLFLAGQFYWQAPDAREQAERLRRLATQTRIPPDELAAAAQEVPVIEPDMQQRVESWPFTAARAIQSILHERLCFVDRLQQIASLTQL